MGRANGHTDGHAHRRRGVSVHWGQRLKIEKRVIRDHARLRTRPFPKAPAATGLDVVHTRDLLAILMKELVAKLMAAA